MKDNLSILTVKSGFLKTEDDDDYLTYDTSDLSQHYYLQNTNINDASAEYIHYSSFTKNGVTYYPYYEVIYDNDNVAQYAVNYNRFLGNCGLICDADIAPTGDSLTISEGRNASFYSTGFTCYWIENRAKLAMYFDDKFISERSSSGQLISAVNVFTVPVDSPQYQSDAVEEAMISWPDEEDETNYY